MIWSMSRSKKSSNFFGTCSSAPGVWCLGFGLVPSPAMGDRSPEACRCNVEPLDDAGIGGLAICARGANPPAGAGAVQGADSHGRGAAKAIAGASVRAPADGERREHTYAALDLGTNNCRLLIAWAAPAR